MLHRVPRIHHREQQLVLATQLRVTRVRVLTNRKLRERTHTVLVILPANGFVSVTTRTRRSGRSRVRDASIPPVSLACGQ